MYCDNADLVAGPMDYGLGSGIIIILSLFIFLRMPLTIRGP